MNNLPGIKKEVLMETVERCLYEARVSSRVHSALCRRVEAGLAIREGDTVSEEFAHDLLYSFRGLIKHGLDSYGKRPGRKFQPVDIETFVCSSSYMDQRDFVRPAIMDHLRALFAEGLYYYEVVEGGAIGTGKNYFADMALAYIVYDLSSYYSPQVEFGLAPGSDIIFMLQSKTVKLAKRVVFGQFSSRLALSPYFRGHFAPDPRVRTELRFPSDVTVMPVSSTDAAALGMNIFGGIIDELSFMARIQRSKKAGHESQVYDQAEKLYTTVIRRMESRFMILGKIPGKLFLLGAANHPQDFISRKIKEAEGLQAGEGHCPLYVMCLAQWESLPEDRFSGEKFRIELPSEQSMGRVLPDGEEASVDAEVKKVPIEYKLRFEQDFVGSLRDFGGVPVGEYGKFIRETEKIQVCTQKFQDVIGPDQLFSVDLVEPYK